MVPQIDDDDDDDADGAGAAMEKEKMMEESFILKNQSLLKWHFLTC